MAGKHHMECCVCGDNAGYFEQHYNRDTGYGICTTCAAEQAICETPERFKSLYGEAGKNFEQPTVDHMGRRYKVMALADTDERANAFIGRTPGASVLLVSRLRIFIVHEGDVGEPIGKKGAAA